ncbi:MAG: HEPN domain-containing protein [Paludibacter sp.]
MDNKIENTENIIKFWMESSDQNHLTMQHLMLTKDYNWALFLGHLVIEKLLKAHYVKKHQKHPLFIHDLLRLSNKIELELTEEQEEWLDEISTFNLNTRYDNYKQEFRTRCTLEYTTFWINKIETLRIWLISQL